MRARSPRAPNPPGQRTSQPSHQNEFSSSSSQIPPRVRTVASVNRVRTHHSPNSLQKNPMIRHSEERRDEEFLFFLAVNQEGFLASLGMTALGAVCTMLRAILIVDRLHPGRPRRTSFETMQHWIRWRRRGDSNPRDPFGPNGFQDRRIQPLSHPSASQFNWQCPGPPSPKGWRSRPAHRRRISHARATLLGSGV